MRGKVSRRTVGGKAEIMCRQACLSVATRGVQITAHGCDPVEVLTTYGRWDQHTSP